MRNNKYGRLVLLANLLLFFLLSACKYQNTIENVATINLLIDDNEMTSASVTGKELLWSKSQIKWKDKTGSIQFLAHIKDADLLLIRSNNSYKSFQCYLEAGDTLNVIYKSHQYKIVGNSIAARQNRLLSEIDYQHNYLSNIHKDSVVANMHYSLSVFNEIEKRILNFEKQNKDASSGFIRFIRFDNKYNYLKSLLTEYTYPSPINKHLSKQEEDVYKSVIEDSDYTYAYFSESYRILLNNYLNYLRFNDPLFNSNSTKDPVHNEKYLASLLKSDELKKYQMAVSLKELFQVDCGLNIKKEIGIYTGFWHTFLLEDYHSIQSREYINHGIKQDRIKDINFSLVTLDGKNIKIKDYLGSWIFLAIGKNKYGYSPYESYYLNHINEAIPELKTYSISTSQAIKRKRIYNYLNLAYAKEDTLKEVLKTENLPISLLINPEGKIELVNLPRPSSGMLEPMLLKIIDEREVK